MARPRAADHDKQRDSIRENAVAAFARLGYASASMADLAAACGVSKASLYHYFDSKEAMLFECLDAYAKRLLCLTSARRPLASMDSAAAKDQLTSLVTELLAEYANSRSYHISLLHDVKFLNNEQAAAIRRQEREVVEHIADLIDSAFPRRTTKETRIPTTMALLGMINFTFAWLREEGPMSRDAFAKIVIDLWFNGLNTDQGVIVNT